MYQTCLFPYFSNKDLQTFEEFTIYYYFVLFMAIKIKRFYPETAFHSYFGVPYRICDKAALLAIIIHIVVVLCTPSLSE